jgi:nucleoside-diphosphate-sugar epimerase
MNRKRIFITGASGCIGHYVVEALIQQTEHELFLLVRNPEKLRFDCKTRPGIHILQGDLKEIEKYSDLLLKDINIAILIATAWGGTAQSYDVNVVKTLALIEMLNPDICERVIYFSTASILDRDNQLLPQAFQFGIDYIRTKYQCFATLNKLAIASKIIAVFPTLVLGGDSNKPYSHISAGLPDVVKWTGLIRWFSADGSFHFIHAKDIAKVVAYLVDCPGQKVAEYRTQESPIAKIVLGNPAMTADETVEKICTYFNKKIYFRIPLSIALAKFFIKVFRIQMDEWSYFSMSYRHFTYQNPVTPANFGLNNYCSTIADAMKVSLRETGRL